MRSAVAAGLLVAATLTACGDDGPVRFERAVCGFDVSVTLDDGAFVVDGADPSPAWRLSWLEQDAWFLGGVSGAFPLRTGPTEDELARLTTPDGTCTGLIGRDPNQPARVVGDSLAFNVARAGEDPDDATWQGSPGAGYVAVADGEPSSSGLPEIRGAVADGPEALVLLFGANDAIWILDGDGDAEQARRRTAVADAVRAAIDASDGVPCRFLVTPSVGDTGVLDLGERYAAEAEQVAELVRAMAEDAGIGVVDWTAASADHHLPDGEDGDWFPDGDEIHPNGEGMAELVDLVAAAVDDCGGD